jgi:hypothetical protein
MTHFLSHDESIYKSDGTVTDCCRKEAFETLSTKSSEIMKGTAITLETIQKEAIVWQTNEPGRDQVDLWEQVAQYTE